MATLEDDRQAVAGLVPVAKSGRSSHVSAFAPRPPSGRLGRGGYFSSLSTASLCRAILCAMAMLICVGACSTAPEAAPVPELPYTFGPRGHGEGACARPDPVRPPADPLPSGCVVRYVFQPGAVEVDLEVFNLPAAGTVVATACIGPAQCPAAGFAPKSEKRSTGSGSDLYTAHIPLRPGEVKGVSRICGVVSTEAIGSFRPPTSGTPLSCLNLSAPLSEAAGALRITPGREGLQLEGWVIDPQTDTSGTVEIRNGVGEASSSGERYCGSCRHEVHDLLAGVLRESRFHRHVAIHRKAGNHHHLRPTGGPSARCRRRFPVFRDRRAVPDEGTRVGARHLRHRRERRHHAHRLRDLHDRGRRAHLRARRSRPRAGLSRS